MLAEISLILVNLPLMALLVPKATVSPPAAAASPGALAALELPSCQGSFRVHRLILGEIQPCPKKLGAQEVVERMRPAIRVFWPRGAVCLSNSAQASMNVPTSSPPKDTFGPDGPKINKKISNH